MIITGIDPGKQGAICLLDEHGGEIILHPCPVVQIKKKREYDLEAMRALLFRSDVVWLEKVHSMPIEFKYKGKERKQGAASIFSFGDGFGIWRGMTVALQIPLHYVAPQTWKAKMLRDLPKDKNSAILRAKELCPDINLKPTPRSRKDCVALAEAYLIARYGLAWGE